MVINETFLKELVYLAWKCGYNVITLDKNIHIKNALDLGLIFSVDSDNPQQVIIICQGDLIKKSLQKENKFLVI